MDDSEVILKVEAAVEKEVYTILKHVKRLVDDFLTSIEVEDDANQ